MPSALSSHATWVMCRGVEEPYAQEIHQFHAGYFLYDCRQHICYDAVVCPQYAGHVFGLLCQIEAQPLGFDGAHPGIYGQAALHREQVADGDGLNGVVWLFGVIFAQILADAVV